MAASSAADSRTWATEPGADSTRSVCSVWIESTSTIAGLRSRQGSASASTRVSASTSSESGEGGQAIGAQPQLLARSPRRVT